MRGARSLFFVATIVTSAAIYAACLPGQGPPLEPAADSGPASSFSLDGSQTAADVDLGDPFQLNSLSP